MATACWCLSAVSLPSASTSASQNQKSSIISCKSRSSIFFGGLRDSAFSTQVPRRTRELSRCGVVCMAPDEEKMTRRSPLDFPIEWERPKPGRRPDIFPKFSPMKTPLPTPLPADPPEEDEEEEEKKEEEEEDPEKEEEEDDKPMGV